MLKMLASACACAVLFLMTSGTAQAQTHDRRTYFTFTQTVMLPGMTLPAGTYQFSLLDSDWSRRVVRVANREGTHTYGLILTVPSNRMVAPDAPEVRFLEAAAGTPLPVKTWWYPGETIGREFVYSNEEELRLAELREAPAPITGTR